jgi:hypothetical protein
VLKRQSNRPRNKNKQTKQEYSNTHDHAVSNCRFFAVRVQRTNVLSCVCAFLFHVMYIFDMHLNSFVRYFCSTYDALSASFFDALFLCTLYIQQMPSSDVHLMYNLCTLQCTFDV